MTFLEHGPYPSANTTLVSYEDGSHFSWRDGRLPRIGEAVGLRWSSAFVDATPSGFGIVVRVEKVYDDDVELYGVRCTVMWSCEPEDPYFDGFI